VHTQNQHVGLLPRVVLSLGAALAGGFASAQDVDREFAQAKVFDTMEWRELGPTNFSGRIVDIAVDPRNSRTFYAATGSGGLFKTDNGGTRFRALFQDQPVFSIGDIAVAPSSPDILYLGTGEANNQRSSYFGDGIYRSADGGETWTHVGLRGTEHIGRIVVHPDNPDVVWVAALGALYSPNSERGLFRTRDGGKTWENTKFISDDVGFVDVAIHPQDPDTLWAASYERRRRAWNFSEDGEGSALWRSTDGGDTWTRLTKGLPSGKIGRIGVEAFAGDGQIVYACVENNNPRTSSPARRPRGERASEGTSEDASETPGEDAFDLPEDAAPGAAAAPIGGEVYRSDDGGSSWNKVSGDRSVGGNPGYYYGQIRVDPNDADRVYVLGVTISFTDDGGETWQPSGGRRGGGASFGRSLHVVHHALWIDPADSEHCLLGNDGGIGQSWDRGATWDHLFHIPAAQFYAIAVDQRDPYWIYGGTQDNGTWGIPNQSLHSGGVLPELAVKIGGGDGFQVAVDPEDPNVVFYESQFGGVSRRNLATGAGRSIKPRRERGQPSLRFNWMSPILMSPHDPRTLYFGSQFVHRSLDRGDSWEVISPDLSSNDPDRIAGDVPHCTVTTLAESPQRRGLLWAGTDDGRVWLSKNDGGRWTELTDRFDGVPPRLWVSRIELSPHDVDTAFVAFTGYREDDRTPYLFLTTDGGETFMDIAHDLPQASVNVVRHHPRNENVLLVGNEIGAYVSIDWRAHWFRLGDLPTTPVHDLLVHPREMDVIVGTHGRGIHVLDGAALEEISPEILSSAAHVFPPRDGLAIGSAPNRGYVGSRRWAGENPSSAAVFSYLLGSDADEPIQLEVQDAAGDSKWSWSSSEEQGSTAGLHQVAFGQTAARGGQRRGGANTRFSGGGRGRANLAAGAYVLVVTAGDREIARLPFEQKVGRALPDASAAGARSFSTR